MKNPRQVQIARLLGICYVNAVKAVCRYEMRLSKRIGERLRTAVILYHIGADRFEKTG